MSAILRLSATVPRAVLLRWYQAGRTARIDCTGFTMVTHETSLPFEPEFEAVDLAEGEFSMIAATSENLALLQPGRSYGLHALLLNADGAPIEEMRIDLEAI